MTTTVIMCGNQKGGVGKTTTAVTLAHELARRAYRTLIIDLDSQGHVGPSLGIPKSPEAYHLLMKRETSPRPVIEARRHLHIIGGNKTTAVAAKHLRGLPPEQQPQLALRHALKPIKSMFDFIIIDTPPGLSILTVNAILASDHILIPALLDPLATDGLVELTKSILQAQREGAAVKLSWVVPTFFERVTRETGQVLLHLVELYKKLVTAPIPRDTRVRKGPRLGKTIWEHAPRCPAALAYLQLAGRILEDLGFNNKERKTPC